MKHNIIANLLRTRIRYRWLIDDIEADLRVADWILLILDPRASSVIIIQRVLAWCRSGSIGLHEYSDFISAVAVIQIYSEIIGASS